MDKLITYFLDPICGWCSGFGRHFAEFYSWVSSEYDLKIVTGGMVPSEYARPVSHKAEFLRETYPQVEELSGVNFGEKFMERVNEGSMIYESETPSLVLHTLVANGAPAHTTAQRIQQLIYAHGIDPSDLDAYAGLAAEVAFKASTFEEEVQSRYVRNLYTDDLYTTQQYAVRGFPFALVTLEGEHYLLARGFVDSDRLFKTFQRALAHHYNPPSA